MKILVLGTRGFPHVQGGVEKHCEELYRRLKKLGLEITVFARIPYIKAKKNYQGINIVPLWSLQKKGIEPFFHTFFASLLCIIEKPDIAHFHNIGPAIFIPLVKLFGIKTVFTYHSINYQHQKWGICGKFFLKLGEFLGVRYADKIIVVSKTTRDFLEKKYGRKDFKLIPNGVDMPDIIPPGKFLKKYNLKPKKYVFTACRFTPEKGLIDLINAYSKITIPGFKLVIAGDADQETEYSKNLREIAGKTKGVVLTGFISDEPLQELYSNTGLFVLPSYYEGLPISLLEALSYGIPVLVSNIPQNREVPLPAFRFFKLGDSTILANKMIELLEVGIAKKEQKQQKEILKERYNWNVIAQETLSVYHSC
jgi:starch synthase